MLRSVVIAEDGQEEFFEALVHGLRDTVLLLDQNLQIRWVGHSVSSLLGRTGSEVLGQSASEFIHPDDIAATVDAISRIVQGLEMTRVNIRLRDATGRWTPVEVTGTDQSGDPRLGGMVLSLRFADYESELGAQVNRVERRSSAILSGLRDGIVATDQFGVVTLVNDMARALFDIADDVPPGDLTLADFPLLDGDGNVQQLPADGGRTPGRIARRSGQIRHVVSTVQQITDDDDIAIGTVVAFHDVTAERRARAELHHQAMHDQLTGLGNRRQLLARLDELQQAIPRATIATFFIDLDGFKLINDNHGHRIGDELISVAAQRLGTILRQPRGSSGDMAHGSSARNADLLVRQGGDEFVALLLNVTESQAYAVAERARLALAEPYHLSGDRFDLTASIGVATATGRDWVGEVILQQADMALYAAKERGRNRVARFDSSLSAAVGREEQQRSILRDALETHRLEMHFQPLVDVRTRRTTGFEALARVRTESGELITPGRFMEAISNTGMMWDLDRRGFELSCKTLETLNRMGGGGPTMACNFSSVSLTHPEFLDAIQTTVDRAGVSPSRICVEITESAALDVGGTSVSVLAELRRRGFHLALDDFGTGYSSLSHLRDLPISSVKVDRSFIERLDQSGDEHAIAEAVVRLGTSLDLGVVAEGVETPAQMDQVALLGFDSVQGNLFAPALSLGDAVRHWSEQLATRALVTPR